MRDQIPFKDIQEFLGAATGTIISRVQAEKLCEDLEVTGLLRHAEVRKLLGDPLIRKALIPRNVEDISLKSVLLNAIQPYWKTGGGKDSKHKNAKSKEAAKKKYDKEKEKYDKLNSQPNRTKEDNERLKRLKKTVLGGF
jgi:hypothetical protein